MPNPDFIERIRTIFLHDKERVTIAEAAGMLGWTRAEMNGAMKNGEIEPVRGFVAKAPGLEPVHIWMNNPIRYTDADGRECGGCLAFERDKPGSPIRPDHG